MKNFEIIKIENEVLKIFEASLRGRWPYYETDTAIQKVISIINGLDFIENCGYSNSNPLEYYGKHGQKLSCCLPFSTLNLEIYIDSKQESLIKFLPYLLCGYFCSFSSNETMKELDRTGLENNKYETLFPTDTITKRPFPPRYNEYLRSFVEFFSMSKLRFLKTAPKTQTTAAAKYVRAMSYYAACVYACSEVRELRGIVDYKKSTELASYYFQPLIQSNHVNWVPPLFLNEPSSDDDIIEKAMIYLNSVELFCPEYYFEIYSPDDLDGSPYTILTDWEVRILNAENIDENSPIERVIEVLNSMDHFKYYSDNQNRLRRKFWTHDE